MSRLSWLLLGSLVLVGVAAVRKWGALDGLAVTAGVWLLMPYGKGP